MSGTRSESDDHGTVLIIDDEMLFLAAISRRLEQVGFKVHTCNGWLGAIPAIHEHEPDVVLIDYNMPVLKGDQLCSLIRSQAGDTDVRILLYSCESDSVLSAAASDSGADGYVRKDASFDTLTRELARVVDAGESQELSARS